MIKLFVGLGNPGPEYAATRHNAGFWWIDALARELKVQLQPERSYWGLAARATVQGQALWLLQPQTFMNLSGKSVAALARFAGAAKVSAILRLPNPRRLATLVAFVHCLEASAQDDGLEVLEVLLRELFGDAIKADKKSRLRTLKDLDQAAATLASACRAASRHCPFSPRPTLSITVFHGSRRAS